MCVPPGHRLRLLSDSFSSVGRWCWCPSRWALNQARSLANSQHKYPGRNTEVYLGVCHLSIACLHLARLSNNFIPDIFIFLLFLCPFSLLLSYELAHFTLRSISLFFVISFFSPSESLTLSVCLSVLSLLRSISPTYLFVLCYFLFEHPPLWMFYPTFLSSPPGVWLTCRFDTRSTISHSHLSTSV